jgi:hypothetical protein
MNHVEADRLTQQAIQLVWRLDAKLVDLSDHSENIPKMRRIHRVTQRAFKRFMRRAAHARKVQHIEIGDLR